MNKETVILGQSYHCQPVGLCEPVIGEVISKLENCLILNVESYNMIDQEEIMERYGKVVVKYTEVHERVLAGCFFS